MSNLENDQQRNQELMCSLLPFSKLDNNEVVKTCVTKCVNSVTKSENVKQLEAENQTTKSNLISLKASFSARLKEVETLKKHLDEKQKELEKFKNERLLFNSLISSLQAENLQQTNEIKTLNHTVEKLY